MNPSSSFEQTRDRFYGHLAPDQITPAQWGNVPELPVEEKLLAAVLWGAIHDLRMGAFAAAIPATKRLQRESEDWFRDQREDWVFSFRAICGHFGIDPDRLSRTVLEASARGDIGTLWICEQHVGRLSGGNATGTGAIRSSMSPKASR